MFIIEQQDLRRNPNLAVFLKPHPRRKKVSAPEVFLMVFLTLTLTEMKIYVALNVFNDIVDDDLC